MADVDEEYGFVGRIASSAAQAAADNIQRYIEMHSESPNGPAKPVNRVMKIAEELDSTQREAILASVGAAISSLQAFRRKLEG